MLIVDTHCHASRDWFEPIESLVYQMDRNNVSYGVLIQISPEYDNSYQFECQRRFPGRFLNVVKVNAADADACDQLARLQEQGAAGVRFTVTTRSPGDDPLRIWRKAAELGLPVSCFGANVNEFASDEFARLIEQLPEVTIVIEHLGALNFPEGETEPYEQRRKVFSLARFPNTLIKIHGLGEFTPRTNPFQEPRPFGPSIPPLFDLAYEAFGPDRIMWGSDYPPVSSREGYEKALNMTMRYFSDKGNEALAKMFGGTAMKVFGRP